MADQIANQSTTFDGKFFKLQNDIDLGGTAWAPIGIPDSHFKGTFDGDGYTISGLYIPATNPAKKIEVKDYSERSVKTVRLRTWE